MWAAVLLRRAYSNPGMYLHLLGRYARYGSLPLAWQTLFPYSAVLRPVPRTVGLEFTNACNFRCGYCDGTNPALRRPVGLMAEETLARIARQIRGSGVQKIRVVGAGEPTIHPQFARFLEMLRPAAPVLAVVTNGHVQQPDRIEALARCADLVDVSVASDNPQGFAQNRTGGRLETVLKFLSRLRALRKGRFAPMIHIRIMKRPSDEARIDQIRRFWRDQGEALSEQMLLDYFRRGADLFPVPHDSCHFERCAQLFTMLTIHWNGDAPLCTNSELQFGPGGLVVGNILDDSLTALWRSGTLEAYRDAHRRLNTAAAPNCRGCPIAF